VNIKVLIADDQALIRSGLRAIIESEPGMEVVGEAGDGAEAVEAVRRLRPHVALMDIRMPRLDGVAATTALLSAREVDVLLLVARGLSNAEIGATLHLAETTVKSHVQSLLGKLGVRDRLQAAVAAYDSGLVRPHGS